MPNLLKTLDDAQVIATRILVMLQRDLVELERVRVFEQAQEVERSGADD